MLTCDEAADALGLFSALGGKTDKKPGVDGLKIRCGIFGILKDLIALFGLITIVDAPLPHPRSTHPLCKLLADLFPKKFFHALG